MPTLVLTIIATVIITIVTFSTNIPGNLFRMAQLNPFMFNRRDGYDDEGIPKVCDCQPCGFLHQPDDLVNLFNCKCKKCNNSKIKPELDYLRWIKHARNNSSDPIQLSANLMTLPGANELPKCSNCHGVKTPNFGTF